MGQFEEILEQRLEDVEETRRASTFYLEKCTFLLVSTEPVIFGACFKFGFVRKEKRVGRFV